MFDTSKMLPQAAKWLEDNPGNNYSAPIYHVGDIKPDVLDRLIETIESLPDDSFATYSKFKNHLQNVGIFTENGDPGNWFHHYDVEGNLIDPFGKRADLQGLIKSVRNTPQSIDTKYMTPLLKELINLPGLKKAWIARLKSNGGTIPPHADSIPQERMRLHVCLTGGDTVYYVGGHESKMTIGGVYWLNTHFTHAVVNNSNEDRYNIVIDCFWGNGNVEEFCKVAADAMRANGYMK